MPIYEYICQECDKQFDALQKISAAPLTECIYCSGKVEKMISSSSFQFKGSGWYITDYKKSKNKSTSSKGKTSSAKNSTALDQKKTEKKADSHNGTEKKTDTAVPASA